MVSTILVVMLFSLIWLYVLFFFSCRDSFIFTGGLGTGCHRNIQCNGTWKSSGSMRREYCE